MVALRVGTDCSGIEAPLQALQQLGVPYEHVFSSEICPSVRKQLLANHNPQILYEDVLARATAVLHHMLTYTWPDGPVKAIARLGKDGACQTPHMGCLESIRVHPQQHPKVVVLENVANALRIDRGDQFNAVRVSLEDVGYVVQWASYAPNTSACQ